jgi:hypothetical protein
MRQESRPHEGLLLGINWKWRAADNGLSPSSAADGAYAAEGVDRLVVGATSADLNEQRYLSGGSVTSST